MLASAYNRYLLLKYNICNITYIPDAECYRVLSISKHIHFKLWENIIFTERFGISLS